ncbi:BTB/POZ domain-containing protein [Prunus yedoensis var. nudiflora]|uniref:BTB/POZ domain-containing protein n=1 Tax=Prunus yedoensis var. nudiflora TaxID=2094558 RepID=A0A314URQ7_PRUYE|nr:BTB/POZ domain-containing protein [Prunus yedoensis var. nudiflora]
MLKFMPPSAESALPRNGFKKMKSESNIATIDVGGQLFQTTKQTLNLAGPDSLFSRISESASARLAPPFIDRDPELFLDSPVASQNR